MAASATSKVMGGILFVLLAVVVLLGFRAIQILQDGEEFNATQRAPQAQSERVLDPDGFVEAWARSEQETYAAAGSRRLEGSGVAIESTYVRVQDQTRRLEREGPTAVIVLDGAEQSCDQIGTHWRCSAKSQAPPLSDRVEGIRRLVTGSDAPYAAIREPTECFTLTAKTEDDVAGPFGARSVICFDGATGAISRTDTVRGKRTEELELSELRSTVTDADFRLPQ